MYKYILLLLVLLFVIITIRLSEVSTQVKLLHAKMDTLEDF